MSKNINRHILIAKLAALALLTLCFGQLPVSAQSAGTHALYQDIFIPPVGLVPDQSLRFTILAPNSTSVRAQVKLHNERGAVIAQSNAATIAAGAFHSFEFKRNAISLAGEADTGRLQVQASISSVRLTFSEAINPVVASMELIDGTGGTSLAGTYGRGSYRLFLDDSAGGHGNDVLVGGLGSDLLMGVNPGQRLRVTLSNPLSSGSEAQRGVIGIYNATGQRLAYNDDIAIPPGEFRSFDFDRAAFPLAGEPDTGRLQVRTHTSGTYTLTFNGQTTSVPLPATWEIIDQATGKTRVFNPATATFFLRNSNTP